MTAGVKRFALNCLFTLHKYGHQPHYIVVVFESDSLSVCLSLNLPCYNASGIPLFQGGPIVNGAHEFNSANANKIWWSKQYVAMSLLEKGYHVHGSDVDVVYFRDVLFNYRRLMNITGSDMVFSAEENVSDVCVS